MAARPPEAPVLGDVQKLREPGIFVTAQRRIDRMIGDDPRLLGIVADAAQRPLGMLARFCDSEVHPIARHLTLLLRRLAVRRIGPPAQHRLARGGGLVETAARREDRRRTKPRRVACAGRCGERLDDRDELVERRLALGLGRLDQHRPVHDQREYIVIG